jgi:hypothetical protein
LLSQASDFIIKAVNVSLEGIDLSLKHFDIAVVAKQRTNRNVLTEPTVLSNDATFSLNHIPAPNALRL